MANKQFTDAAEIARRFAAEHHSDKRLRGGCTSSRYARFTYANDAAEAGFDDSFIYEELKHVHRKRRIPFEPMMREAGLEPFREWARKNDRISY